MSITKKANNIVRESFKFLEDSNDKQLGDAIGRIATNVLGDIEKDPNTINKLRSIPGVNSTDLNTVKTKTQQKKRQQATKPISPLDKGVASQISKGLQKPGLNLNIGEDTTEIGNEMTDDVPYDALDALPVSIKYNGKEYWSTGKNGKRISDGTWSREYEAEDSSRVWLGLDKKIIND